MINRTRITVDEATRDVLDQLSTELSRTPSWAIQLTEDLPQAVAGALSEGQARNLESIAASSRALQTKVGQQADGLNEVRTQIQALVAWTKTMQADASGQAERIAGVHESLNRLDARLERQVLSVDHLGQGLASLVELTTQSSSMVAEQRRELDGLRGDCRTRAAEQAEGLTAVGTQMQALVSQTKSLRADTSGQAERIAGLHASLSRLDERFERQDHSVDRLGQELARLAELTIQGSREVAEQGRALDELKKDSKTFAGQHAAGQAELAGGLQKLTTALSDIRAEQAIQCDALQQLATSLEHLNRPWWQRIFSFSRSQK